jgi:hypothetical protein
MRYFAALALTLATPARAATADKWLAPFSTDDGMARLIVIQQFEREVAPADRATALAEIWNAAGARTERDRVRASVLAYLQGKPPAELPWTPELRQIVHQAARDPELRLRRLALTTAIRRGATTDMRDDFVRALDDSDELTRDLAIGEVARWADHRPLLQGYVQRNSGKKAHEATVKRARFLIEKGGLK